MYSGAGLTIAQKGTTKGTPFYLWGALCVTFGMEPYSIRWLTSSTLSMSEIFDITSCSSAEE